MGLGVLTPPRFSLCCRYSLGQQERQGSCRATPSSQQERWNICLQQHEMLGVKLSAGELPQIPRNHKHDLHALPGAPDTRSSGGNNCRFALSPFSLRLFQLINETNRAENVPVTFEALVKGHEEWPKNLVGAWRTDSAGHARLSLQSQMKCFDVWNPQGWSNHKLEKVTTSSESNLEL